MKSTTATLSICFIMAAFVIARTNALSCFQCAGCAEPHDANKNPSTNCSFGMDTCMKTTIRYPGGAMIQKTCIFASACTEKSLTFANYGFQINCCTTDDCNLSSFVYPGVFTISLTALFSTLSVHIFVGHEV